MIATLEQAWRSGLVLACACAAAVAGWFLSRYAHRRAPHRDDRSRAEYRAQRDALRRPRSWNTDREDWP